MSFLGTLLALIQAIPTVLGIIKNLQERLGPDWDKALVEIGRGVALLPAVKSKEEAQRALDSIRRGFNPR